MTEMVPALSTPEDIEAMALTLHRLRTRLEDAAIGGVSLERVYEPRFDALGATLTQSTDYRMLDAMFAAAPLAPDDVLVDVGCGEGRVISHLYLHGFRGPMTGIELDSEVAELAAARLSGLADVRILCANVFECERAIADATALFMFNPFNGNVTYDFIEFVERVCTHRVRLYYCGDYYHAFLDTRPGWRVIASEEVERAGEKPLSYSIYEFDPNAR